ncbi:MAG: methyltransferase domain-containing protein [Longimicrobiales bacterium]
MTVEKRIVSLQELSDAELHPTEFQEEYLRILRRSTGTELPAGERRDVVCPFDQCGPGEPAFERDGFRYRDCVNGGGTFASPRPSDEALTRFFQTSEAARYWRETLFPATREARMEKLVRPRADWILNSVREVVGDPDSLLDMSAGSGPLLRLLAEEASCRRLAAGPPAPDALPDTGGTVEVLAADDAEDGWQVVTLLEALERAHDPNRLLATAARRVRPGGLLFVTCTLSSGFGNSMLRETAPSLVPPDKLNLPSVRGLRMLLEGEWDVVELSTPGRLDVEQVRREMDRHPDASWPPFLRHLVTDENPEVREAFQQFLQEHRLASFGRVVAVRR